VPPAAVQAVTQSITIVYPASGNITYVKPGGLVTVGTSLVDYTDGSARVVNYQVYNASLGNIYNRDLSTDNAFGSKSFNINDPATQGLYNLVLRPTDNTSISATNVGCIYVDTTLPTVTLSSPASSACWKSGTDQNICWTATDAPSSTENVTIYADLSIDGGGTWTTYPSIINAVSYRQGYWCFTYTAPNVNMPACQIRIKAIDRALNDSGWVYSPLFSILNIGPTINITSPVAGDSWNGGSSHNITATLTGYGSSVSYMIGLWKGATNTENITTSWGSGTLAANIYSLSRTWAVSNTTRGSTFQIGIWARDCAGNITGPQMSGYFTVKDVVAPTCAVTRPTTGSIWYAGSTENITWTCSDNVPVELLHCTLYYSTTGTDPYTYIGEADYSQGSNYYPWTIPAGISGTNCKIKLYCCDKETPTPNCTTVYSNAFTVLPPCTGTPSITLCSPMAAGISWQAGTVQNITWTVSDTQSTSSRVSILIQLTTNGVDWATIANLSNQPQAAGCTGSYPWAVSDNASASAVIKLTVTNICGNTATSQSTNPFTITAATNPVQTACVTLYPGWNLISLPLIPTNTDINYILGGCMPSVISVQYYNGTEFIDYTPGAEGNTLTTMADGKAYWIKMAAGCTFCFQGRSTNSNPLAPPSPSYTFSPGWQMAGFKSLVPQTVEEYFKGACGVNYSNSVSGYCPIDVPTWTDLGCHDNMTSGRGYWVRFLGTTAYTFDAGTK
jgi:hypothetical protein